MEQTSQGQTAMSVNLGSQQLATASKQIPQVDLLPRFHPTMPGNLDSHQLPPGGQQLVQGRVQSSMSANAGTYQFLPANRQSLPMEQPAKFQTPMSAYFGLQPLSSINRHPFHINSLLNVHNCMSTGMGPQSPSLANKRPVQMVSPKVQTLLSPNMVPQQFSTPGKRLAQGEPQKPQIESFQIVRTKFRESLSAALAMVSQQQNKVETARKGATSEAGSPEQAEAGAQSGLSSAHTSETLASNAAAKCNEELNAGQNLSSNVQPKNIDDKVEQWTSESQEAQLRSVDAEVLPNTVAGIKDELLQGHGLCWASDTTDDRSKAMRERDTKKLKLSHEGAIIEQKETPLQSPEALATKIEAELFKLYGGVNKKYKEKGRSLLFNLKDRSNPELRERVMSGDIAPERLCAMTAEELASKELSEWRLAKAEEMAQMVVLPDSEVDMRRLVKKTHKGEVQVEVERDDSISVEVAVGASVLTQLPPKVNEAEAQIKSRLNDKRKLSKSNENKASEGSVLAEKGDLGDDSLSGNMDTILQEKSDLMQELMADDDLKDTELLPPIVSLDEFMEALDTEPPFVNLSEDAQHTPSSGGKNSDSSEPEKKVALENMETKPDPASDHSASELDSSQASMATKLCPEDNASEDPVKAGVESPVKKEIKDTGIDDNLKAGPFNSESGASDIASKGENIWEGLLQFSASSLATVVGLFKSGEKASTKEWPSLLEIKGRVRLDAFEKFLQELPLSRSRAVMVVQFCWKEGSTESGRLNLSEAIDSYIADARLGYAEPAPGMELYFCPAHKGTAEMLRKHIPKEHTEILNSAISGLIGVVVWRRPHVSISPRLSSHHKHNSSKKQFSSRKQQNSNSNSSSRNSKPHPPYTPKSQPSHDDDDDDVPPGFGPGDDDDLPEFDFVNNSSQLSAPKLSKSSGVSMGLSRVMPAAARPVEKMRQLVHKYGQSETGKKPVLSSMLWNDDDDMPEWQPSQDAQPQQVLPPPPPTRPHAYQQQTVQQQQQPFLANQHVMQLQPQHQVSPQQLGQLATPLPMAMQPSLTPQVGLVPGPNNAQHPGWQPMQWWPSARVPTADVGGVQINAMMQPCHYGQPNSETQYHGVPSYGASQNGVGWRPDLTRSRGT